MIDALTFACDPPTVVAQPTAAADVWLPSVSPSPAVRLRIIWPLCCGVPAPCW